MGGKNNYKGKYNKGKKNNGYNKGKNQHYHHGNGAGGAGAGGGGRPQGFNVQLCRHFVSAAKNQRPCNTTHAAHLKDKPHRVQRQAKLVRTKQNVPVSSLAYFAAKQVIFFAQGSVISCVDSSFADSTFFDLGAGAEVGCLLIHQKFLFCGYSAPCTDPRSPTKVPVGMIKCWDLDTAAEFKVWGSAERVYCHDNAVTALEVAPVSGMTMLFSASKDCTIKMYSGSAAGFPGVATFRGHIRAVTSLLWVPSCGRLYSGSEDQNILVWNPAEPQQPKHTITDAHAGTVTGLICFPVKQAGTQVSHLLSTSLEGRIAMHSLAVPDKPQKVMEPALLGSGICSAELAGIPATGANVLVLGLNSGVVNFRLVAPGFPDQGSVMERFNEGHKSNSRVRAVLAVAIPSGVFVFTGASDGQLIPWQYFP